MKHILCFGDSNTYGLNPGWMSGEPLRHDISVRWTGRLQKKLGDEYRIIEEGLNGRTTVFESPLSPGRSGVAHFSVCVESHLPLDVIIIMLGTNDTLSSVNVSPSQIAMGISRLVKVAQDPFLYAPGTKPPKLLIVAPVPIGEDALKLPDGITDKAAIEKSHMLAEKYRQTAKLLGCEFLDLAPVARTAPGEGVHLNAEAHEAIASAMAEKLLTMADS